MQAARELRSYGVACCVLLLAAAPAACGEETGSGVNSSKTFDELSNQELTTICEWAVNLVSVEDLITYGCYITALMGSGKDREQCEVVAAECVEDSEANADDLSCMFNDDLTGCASEITVGQLEACFRAQFSLLSDIAREIVQQCPRRGGPDADRTASAVPRDHGKLPRYWERTGGATLPSDPVGPRRRRRA